ncbi:MAG: murein biosynthesis integral membrane protein MurJ [Actinobacteria bacterium]|nr:murein biosynthesis integral membrane protein MurJ [Actinomycetota bacterium]
MASEDVGAGPDTRRNSTLVAAGILLSRISGLVREAAIGRYLGASASTEAFRTALRIPNLMQNLLGEGVLSASFIPVYSRYLAEGRDEEAGRVAGAVAGLLLSLAGALVVIGVVFARPLTSVFAAGFTGAKFELTVTLVRIITPGVGVLVLSAWCLGVLNSHRRFFLAYVAPVLWNAAMVTGLVVAAVGGGTGASLATALAWGTLVGGVLQFAVQLPGVLRLASGLRLSVDRHLPGIRRVLAAFGPVVVGRGVVQLSAYVDLVLASFLATGALASLTFAQTLYVLPISLFGMSVAAAELPELSSVEHRDAPVVIERVETGLQRIAFYVVPSAMAFVVLGDLLVGALYQRGEFDPRTTTQVWLVLTVYSVGLLASTASRLLQSALYGIGNTRAPAAIATVRVLVSALVGVLLMFQLDQFQLSGSGVEQVGDLPNLSPAAEALRGASDNLYRLGAVGLAAGAAVGSWVEWTLLRSAVRLRFGRVRLGGSQLVPVLQAAVAAGLAAFVTRFVVRGLPLIPAALVAVVVTGGVYILVARWLAVPEADDLVDGLTSRWRG